MRASEPPPARRRTSAYLSYRPDAPDCDFFGAAPLGLDLKHLPDGFLSGVDGKLELDGGRYRPHTEAESRVAFGRMRPAQAWRAGRNSRHILPKRTHPVKPGQSGSNHFRTLTSLTMNIRPLLSSPRWHPEPPKALRVSVHSPTKTTASLHRSITPFRRSFCAFLVRQSLGDGGSRQIN